MKPISNFPVWVNGVYIDATQFLLLVNYNDLLIKAIFYYALIDATGVKLYEHNLNMTGSDYADYTTNSDANTFAYKWAANLLGLNLI